MREIWDSVLVPIAAVSIIALLGACAETKQVSMATPAAPSWRSAVRCTFEG